MSVALCCAVPCCAALCCAVLCCAVVCCACVVLSLAITACTALQDLLTGLGPCKASQDKSQSGIRMTACVVVGGSDGQWQAVQLERLGLFSSHRCSIQDEWLVVCDRAVIKMPAQALHQIHSELGSSSCALSHSPSGETRWLICINQRLNIVA